MEQPTDREITLCISLPGQYFEITRERKWGDNPIFYSQQVEQILQEMIEPLRGMIAAVHGPQATDPPLNGL